MLEKMVFTATSVLALFVTISLAQSVFFFLQ
jgi:hypothetical protein